MLSIVYLASILKINFLVFMVDLDIGDSRLD